MGYVKLSMLIVSWTQSNMYLNTIMQSDTRIILMTKSITLKQLNIYKKHFDHFKNEIKHTQNKDRYHILK